MARVSSVLRLYTDFVCPFCFIAEESTVPRLLAELDLELDWYGFELHPGTPPGGVPLGQLFRGVPLDLLHARTRRFGASFGVEDFQPPDWLRNSRMALAIAEHARDEGRLEPWRQAATRSQGIRGIPTFAIGGASVVGCQPYATLLSAALGAGAVRRGGSSASS